MKGIYPKRVDPLKIIFCSVTFHDVLCFGLWVTRYLDRGTYTMLSRILHLDPFRPQTSSQPFLLCHQIKTHEKSSWWVYFTLSRVLGMICVNKNVHLVMQHPSLGSMTEGATETSEILIPIPKPGQELSIYTCLSPFKRAEFMHPKREGRIVINSRTYFINSPNLGRNYLWTKPASNK